MKASVRISMLVAALCMCLSCSGGHTSSPIEEQSDTSSGDTGEESLVTVAGTVHLAGPVVGARVIVSEMHGMTVGTILMETTTDDDGAFAVSVPLVAGNLLQVKVDLGGAETMGLLGDITLPEESTLATLLPIEAGDTEVHLAVTPWTTMAKHLAMAYERDGMSVLQATSTAYTRMADHLFRPGNSSLAETAPPDPLDLSTSSGSDAEMAALASAGLLVLAEELQLGSPCALVEALAQDLDDGLFDGASTDGDIGVALSSQTTRFDLAKAVVTFVVSREGYPLSEDDLAAAGGLLDDLSTDDGPLYPEDEPPIPYTSEAGELAFVAPTPEEGSAHDEPFTVRAVLKNGTAVAMGVEGQKLDVDTDDATYLEATVTPQDLEDGGLQVTVYADLSDGTRISVSRDFVIDTTGPTLEVTSHIMELQYVNEANQVMGGTVTDQGVGVEEVVISLDGVTWTPVDILDLPTWEHTVSLTEGEHDVLVKATDLLGAESETLVVPLMVDLTPPVATFVAPTPEEGACLSEPFTVAAEATDEVELLTLELVSPTGGRRVRG